MAYRKLIAVDICVVLVLFLSSVAGQTKHPVLYATNEDKPAIIARIKSEAWAAAAWKSQLASIDKYVNRHQTNPQWIVSRLAMYWKDGERFTQCYLKNQAWDYGTGNAPVPTVRMPGMRVWNEFVNVPLEDRLPYNESGDMKGISKANPEAGVVIVPYKKSGHLIRGNNVEILTLAEKAAFAYWINGEEKYARFAADVFNTWLIGTYYMNPILDPEKSSGGPGGYEPGGILGYYDYEQIHDDLQTHAAYVYDFLYDYLCARPTNAIKATGKSYAEVASTVFRRFVDIGMVRGGKKGNWNINGWEVMMPSILMLEPDSFYADGKGKGYYIPFYTSVSGKYHDALPDILKDYDPVTGLWPESPGYALNTMPSLVNIAMMLYRNGVNTIEGNPMMQKAALAVFPWLDARGNVINFGDGRGGPANFSVFERLLTYYSWMQDRENAAVVASAIQQGIQAKQYFRSNADWKGILLNVPQLPVITGNATYARAAWSAVHRHIVMKNGNDTASGLMFTLYGGTKGKHLSPNGLAMQLYGRGWALAPDASGYESYWSKDFSYHQSATGSNTILPGYTEGEITIHAMEPRPAADMFTAVNGISPFVSFADVLAGEKRRSIAIIRNSATTGYYVDIFYSHQRHNDYLYHNLGDTLQLQDNAGKPLLLTQAALDTSYTAGYKYFRNPRMARLSGDLYATWQISSVTPSVNMAMWMKGEPGRIVYRLDAPYTNLNQSVAPNKGNIAPGSTPAIIVRETGSNEKGKPFVAVFEPYSANGKSITSIQSLADEAGFTAVLVEAGLQTRGRKEYILHAVDEKVHQSAPDLVFEGCFGVACEDMAEFQYLYLGHGKLLKKGKYSIESGEATAAGLINHNGTLSYSATTPIKLTLPLTAKDAGNMKLLYCKNGRYVEADTRVDVKAQTISGNLPAGYDVLIKIDRVY